MLLPLIAAYLLFAWITTYDQEQKITEHLQVLTELETIKDVLDDEKLYTSKPSHDKIAPLLNDDLSITLLNKDGFILYSNKETQAPQFGYYHEHLYEDLYELKQGYHSYTYKQPVFRHNEVVGFFQVEKVRQQWVEAVSKRTIIVTVLFFGIFTLIFLTVVKLMNRKLNKPLAQLMNEMSTFAAGEAINETSVAKDEIGELKKHFYKMSRKINEAQRMIEQEQLAKEYIIASVSHDLKTPLTSIKAYAESLQKESLQFEEQEQYKRVIIEKAEFMQHMLDDLLTYTLLQSPTYEIERVTVDGGEFFEMLLSGYDVLAKQYGVHLQTEINVSGEYLVNPQQMIRVIDNLMGNAVKFTEEGHAIHLAALSESELPPWLYKNMLNDFTFQFNDFVYIVVQNEGQGIGPDDLKEIFLPLYQTDKSRSKNEHKGTGLGLSIAKQIIEKHDGTIHLFSEIDVGTCVICRLPKLKRG